MPHSHHVRAVRLVRPDSEAGHRAPAGLGATCAAVLGHGELTIGSLELELVVEQELGACRDVVYRRDEDATAHHGGFAVRLAAVIEPAGRVTTMAAVDDEAVAEVEQEGVARLIRRPVAGGVVPGDDPAEVLDDLIPRCEVASGEQTSAMDGRLANSCASH